MPKLDQPHAEALSPSALKRTSMQRSARKPGGVLAPTCSVPRALVQLVTPYQRLWQERSATTLRIDTKNSVPLFGFVGQLHGDADDLQIRFEVIHGSGLVKHEGLLLTSSLHTITDDAVFATTFGLLLTAACLTQPTLAHV